jgi:hypothetical protein
MTEIPKEYQAALDEVIRWAESVCLRLSVIEALTRDRLNITEDEWKMALTAAGDKIPADYKPQSMSETIEAVEIHFRSLAEL